MTSSNVMKRWRPSPKKKRRIKAALYEKAKGICEYCGKKITYERSTIDHAIPRSQGGTDDLSNLRLACWYCNMAMLAMSLEEKQEMIAKGEKPDWHKMHRNRVNRRPIPEWERWWGGE